MWKNVKYRILKNIDILLWIVYSEVFKEVTLCYFFWKLKTFGNILLFSILCSLCFIIPGNPSSKKRRWKERGPIKQFGGKRHCFSDHRPFQTCKHQNGKSITGEIKKNVINEIKMFQCVPEKSHDCVTKPHMTSYITDTWRNLHPAFRAVLCKLLINQDNGV